MKSSIAVPQASGDKMVSFTAKLPRSFVKQLRIRAAKHDRTLADEIMAAFAEHPTEPIETPSYWKDRRR